MAIHLHHSCSALKLEQLWQISVKSDLKRDHLKNQAY